MSIIFGLFKIIMFVALLPFIIITLICAFFRGLLGMFAGFITSPFKRARKRKQKAERKREREMNNYYNNRGGYYR